MYCVCKLQLATISEFRHQFIINVDYKLMSK